MIHLTLHSTLRGVHNAMIIARTYKSKWELSRLPLLRPDVAIHLTTRSPTIPPSLVHISNENSASCINSSFLHLLSKLTPSRWFLYFTMAGRQSKWSTYSVRKQLMVSLGSSTVVSLLVFGIISIVYTVIVGNIVVNTAYNTMIDEVNGIVGDAVSKSLTVCRRT